MSTPEIDPIHTSCKDCVFAIYDGKTQVDCESDFLNRLRQQTDILDVYDEEKEFFVVNKKKCLSYRDGKWTHKYNLTTKEERSKKLHEENKLNYMVVVNLKNFHEDPNLEYLSSSLSKLSVAPQKIVLIRYQKDNIKYPLEVIQESLKKSGLRIPWRLQTMLEDDIYDNILAQVVLQNKNIRFCLSIDKPNEDFNNIVNTANTIVHEDLSHFLILSNASKNNILFSCANYRYLLFVEQKDMLKEVEYQIV